MIVVKDIDILQVPYNRYWQIASMPENPLNAEFNSKEEYELHQHIIDVETLYTKSFVNSHGRKIDICMDKKTQNVLGIYIDCFENMSNENRKLVSALHKVSTASLWERIKWVFTGVK